MTGYAIPSTVSARVHDVLGWITREIGRLDVIDWVLFTTAIALVVSVWVRAASSARLGSIDVAEVTVDDVAVGPAALRAALRKKLGDRGWMPASTIPGGSPTVADLATAVGEAPIPQAKFVAALIALIPKPPTATNFKVTPTASMDLNKGAMLTYQLECIGVKPRTDIETVVGADWDAVIDDAAKAIYCGIQRAAPDIYPVWSHWTHIEALTLYREGLEIEDAGTGPADATGAATPNLAARDLYRRAAEMDPENMLARLRAANCLERDAAGENDPNLRANKQVTALEAYVSIRLRQPAIFEVGYRISVLLGGLGRNLPADPDRCSALRTALRRLELESAREIDARDEDDRSYTLDQLWRLQAWLGKRGPGIPQRLSRALDILLPSAPFDDERDMLGSAAGLDENDLKVRLQRAARREARRARRCLRPLWTILHEGRLRHRFEPTGRERRQLRKALGISQMCLRARAAKTRPVSDLRQFWWRAWVFWRHIAGRAYVAGWQAHYNAACFYAVLPQAAAQVDGAPGRVPFGSARIRERALWHLAQAISSANGELPCRYVRDEDPDLNVLRTQSSIRFVSVVGRLCPDELVVHYLRPWNDGAWSIVATDPAAADGASPPSPVDPFDCSPSEAVYRIKVQDENKSLRLQAQSGVRTDDPGWLVVPARWPHGEIYVTPNDPTIRPRASVTRVRRQLRPCLPDRYMDDTPIA